MKSVCIPVLLLLVLWIRCVGAARAADDEQKKVAKKFTVYPIGWVRKAEGRTTIVVDEMSWKRERTTCAHRYSRRPLAGTAPAH